MTEVPRPLTLVTVTSRSFLPGTRVMLDSFLAHNKWFDGAIKVVHADLNQDEQAELALDFDKLECCLPPEPLLSALDALAAAHPRLEGRIARFHSLSTFWMEADGDVLFCDSDMVFTGDVSDVFEAEGEFLAAPDAAMIEGKYRHPVTMLEMLPDERASDHRSFNAGFMLMREGIGREDYRSKILALLEPAWWAAVQSDHTDQALLYVLMGKQVTLIESRFNQLVGHAARLRRAGHLPATDALLLHFNGPCKPWKPETHILGAAQDGFMVVALKQWFEAHTRYLARRHFRQ